MLQRKNITMLRDQVATRVKGLSGRKLRRTCLIKGSILRHWGGPNGQRLGSTGLGDSWTQKQESVFLQTKKQLATPLQTLRDAFQEVREGKWLPDRENDELTCAISKLEHSGRTRGTYGSVPWYIGFSEWNDTYRSRARKEKTAYRPAVVDRRKINAAAGTTRCTYQPASYRPISAARRSCIGKCRPIISAEKQRGFHGARSAHR